MKTMLTIILSLLYSSMFAQVSQAAIASLKGTRDHGGKSTTGIAEKAPHRHNADFSWNSNTDNYYSEEKLKFAEAAHFKYNFGGNIFINPPLGNGNELPSDRQGILDGGRWDISIYFNLNDWTTNDTADLRTQIQEIKDSLSLTNISAISYRGGDDEGARDSLVWLKQFLGGRNSTANIPTDTPTSLYNFYGIVEGDTLGNLINPDTAWNVFRIISQASTSRFVNGDGWVENDSASTAANAITSATFMLETAQKRGFYRNFTHLHTLFETGVKDWRNGYFGFLKNHRDSISSNNYFEYSAGYEEIIEYAYARDLISNTSTSDIGDGIRLSLDFTNNEDIDPSLIETPVSIVITTVGTNLEGNEIICTGCEGIRKIATDSFALDLKIPSDLSQKTVDISHHESGVYYDFTKPAITSATLDGTDLNVTTDKATIVTAFYGNRNGEDWEIEGTFRSGSTYQTSHTIDLSAITPTAKDIRIGVITKEKQSILSSPYRF